MFVKKQAQFIPYKKFLRECQWNNRLVLDHIGSNFIFLSINYLPADTDVFKISPGRLKRSRRLTTKQDIVTMSGKRHRIYDVLKTSDLRRLEDLQFTTSWRRPIYVILKMSNLRRFEDVWFTPSSGRLVFNVLKDVWFMSSWRRPICDVSKTSDLQRLQDVWFTTSWRRPIYVICRTAYV